MGDDIVVKKRRGRPFGYKLTEETKEKIRQKRLGTKHSQRTKNKISKSLSQYFKNRDSLAASLEQEYSYVSEQAANWVYDNRDVINETDHVMTERRMLYLRQLEIAVDRDIENLFGHNVTPEFLMMVREDLQELGCTDLRELYSLVG